MEREIDIAPCALWECCHWLPAVCRSRGPCATDDNNALDPKQSVEDNLRSWAKMDGQPACFGKGIRRRSIWAACRAVSPILSAGQKRRVSLARMIASGGEIWLLDEPLQRLGSSHGARLDEAIIRHVGRAAASR